MAMGLLALGHAADQRGLFSQHVGDWHRYHGRVFDVLRVCQNGTLEIAVSDGELPTTHVVLLGVCKPRPTPGGAADSRFESKVAGLIRRGGRGQKIRLELEPHRLRDSNGRVLAYAVLADETLLNERLLAEGWCHVDERLGHRRIGRFALLQMQAKKDGVGCWANSASGHVPVDHVKGSSERRR